MTERVPPERRAASDPAGSRLVVCQQHSTNNGVGCLSCHVAIDWNIWRRFCACGVPATGYRTLGREASTEYFCDAHFQDVS